MVSPGKHGLQDADAADLTQDVLGVVANHAKHLRPPVVTGGQYVVTNNANMPALFYRLKLP